MEAGGRPNLSVLIGWIAKRRGIPWFLSVMPTIGYEDCGSLCNFGVRNPALLLLAGEIKGVPRIRIHVFRDNICKDSCGMLGERKGVRERTGTGPMSRVFNVPDPAFTPDAVLLSRDASIFIEAIYDQETSCFF